MLGDLDVFEIVCGILNIILLFEVTGLFFYQYRKSKEPLSFLLTICFIAFSGSSIFYFLRFFVQSIPFYQQLEVALRFSAFTSFVYLFEKNVKKRKLPYLTLMCIVCILAILLLPYQISYMIGFTIYIAALIVIYNFFIAYRETEGKIRVYLRRSLLSGFILGIGIGLSADYVVIALGEPMILIGIILQLIGLLILGSSFYLIHSTDEFVWINELQDLFVIFNSVCIFQYSAPRQLYQQTNTSTTTPTLMTDTSNKGDLYGGGLASVLIVAQSITKSDEPPEHIEFQNTHFIVIRGTTEFSGDKVIAVLIVKKDLLILHEKLQRFIREFEKKFKDNLENWNGNIKPIADGSVDLIKIFQPQGRKEG